MLSAYLLKNYSIEKITYFIYKVTLQNGKTKKWIFSNLGPTLYKNQYLGINVVKLRIWIMFK